MTTPRPTMTERRRTDPDWWRGGVIYQVYPRSFQDSNGDGIGDLPGITARLEHIASLGVDAIWLSPFFTSPMADFGYDVSDYRNVDPIFGTLKDFDELVAKADSLGIGIIIDLVLSHSSEQHPWFQQSRASRTNSRADWYVWADAKPDGTPPNNWLSLFGGSAWQWDTGRQQYYLHNFLASQPDFNFHCPAVRDAMIDIARFWLDRGVVGFRLDTVNFYTHDAQLRDNPPAPQGHRVVTVPPSNPYGRQLHLYDKNQPENLLFLERLRQVMDEYPGTTSIGELGTDENVYELTAAYTEAGRRLHMTYSFDLLSPNGNAAFIRNAVEAMENGIGSGWPSWALSNHDFVRVVTRWGYQADAVRFGPMAVALVCSLRGTPSLYQGEELALAEADVPFELLQDPYGIRFWPEFKGRDGCRTPMPWVDTDQRAGGFSQGKPWLPVPGEHLAAAVSRQSGDLDSPLHRVQTFLNWRRGQVMLQRGDIRFFDAPGNVLAFERSAGAERIVCLFNLSPERVEVNSPELADTTAMQGHGFEVTARGAGGAGLTLDGFGVWFGRG